MADQRLFYEDVAALAGVKVATVRRAHSIAQSSRDRLAALNAALAAGLPVPADLGRLPQAGDMPAADGRVRRGTRPHGGGQDSPFWYAETIRPWASGRRGPGQPRKPHKPPAPEQPRAAPAVRFREPA